MLTWYHKSLGGNLKPLFSLKIFKLFFNGVIYLTCAGTATASFAGISLGSRKMLTRYNTDPENTVAKKIFHIVNQSTLLHALFSISLWEMYPWMEERNSMIGGTILRNNWRIRLGRYPVITWLTNVLQTMHAKFSIPQQIQYKTTR